MEETNIRGVEDAVNVSAPTEDRNPASVHIDRLPTLEVLQLLNAEDSTVPTAVSAVLPELARLVDARRRADPGGRRGALLRGRDVRAGSPCSTPRS